MLVYSLTHAFPLHLKYYHAKCHRLMSPSENVQTLYNPLGTPINKQLSPIPCKILRGNRIMQTRKGFQSDLRGFRCVGLHFTSKCDFLVFETVRAFEKKEEEENNKQTKESSENIVIDGQLCGDG